MINECNLMVLGGGIGQVPLIQSAKNLGFRTIVVGSPGNYPGYKIADICLEFNFMEKVKIIEAVKKYKINGIVTQVDSAVEIAAEVAEEQGLPSIGLDVAKKFTNKKLMHEECEKLGVRVARWYSVRSLEEAYFKIRSFEYPFVVKPSDSSASKGVSIIENVTEVENALKNAFLNSDSNEIIIEEFIEGEEYVFESITNNNSTTILAVGKREYFNIKGKKIPSATIFYNYENDSVVKEASEICADYISGSGLLWGLSHSEFIINRGTNEIVFIETSARGGGASISSDLVPLYTGININELLVKMAVGQKVEIPKKNKTNKIVAYISFLMKPGIIKNDFNSTAIEMLSGVKKVYGVNFKKGDIVGEIDHKGSRYGPIVIEAKDMDDFEMIKSNVMKKVSFLHSFKNKVYQDAIWN